MIWPPCPGLSEDRDICHCGHVSLHLHGEHVHQDVEITSLYLENCVRSWKVQVISFVMIVIHYCHPQVGICRDVFSKVTKMQ